MNDFIWVPDEAVTGEVGDDHNGEGVHAFKSRAGATKYALSQQQLVAVGQVKLWGDVLEATEGYRAQYAKVHSLVDVLHGGYRDGGAFTMVNVGHTDMRLPAATVDPSACVVHHYTNTQLLDHLRQKYNVVPKGA
jgi:hypothetical protein